MDTLNRPKQGQYLTFIIEKEFYGIEIHSIKEINKLCDITPVPGTMPHVKGVINLRGKIISVASLRQRFNLPEIENTRDTCIVVADTPHGQAGMIVDAVSDVIFLKENQIDDPPVIAGGQNKEFVRGLGKNNGTVVILIDVNEALIPGTIKNHEQTEANF